MTAEHLTALLLIVSQAFGESVLTRKRSKETSGIQQKQNSAISKITINILGVMKVQLWALGCKKDYSANKKEPMSIKKNVRNKTFSRGLKD